MTSSLFLYFMREYLLTFITLLFFIDFLRIMGVFLLYTIDSMGIGFSY